MKTLVLFFLMLFMNCQGKKQQAEILNGERYASVIGLKPEYQEQYIILHKHTFPQVLEQIRESNIRNYSIFLRDGILFSFFEYTGQDFDQDMEKMGEDETTREWWKLTDPTQIPLETRKEGEWWASMEEWTHVADKVVPSSTIQKRYVYVTQIKDNKKEQLKQSIVHNTHNLDDELKRVNIQNKGMYVKDNRLYTYFEYYGDNFEQDIDKLENTPEYQQWWQKIKSLLEPPSDTEKLWVPMEEVFHTD